MKRTLWIVATLITLALSFRPAARAEQQLSAATSVYLPLISRSGTAAQTAVQRQMADQVLALVNSERAVAGCAALTMNDKLIMAAQGHSQDMAEKGFFSHTNPDPSRATLSQRIDAVGYSWSALGENIAAGYSTPTAVMAGWMSSSGHRANILNCSYAEIGVGYYAGGSYGSYWTQDFGRP
ncbi:MAG: CAP domain-containing protein [Chloroflexales bacterium]